MRAASRLASIQPPGLSVWARFVIGLSLGAVGAALLPTGIHPYVRMLVAWDVGGLIFLALTWPLIRYGDPVRDLPTARGASAKVLVTIVVALLASLFATGIMMRNASVLQPPQRGALLALAALAVVCTWMLNNLVFAFGYAFAYYRHREKEPSAAPLIDFQGERPGYLDFVYLAFEVGITFGVTDTGLSSSKVRRLVLGHSILSFWFNAVILALTVNLVSSLL